MSKLALVIGHSEQKQGAVNKDSGVTEFIWNRKFVEAIYFGVSDKWIDMGLWPSIKSSVPLELDGEPPIEIFERTKGIRDLVKRINSWNPDLAVEFHCNAFDGKTSGTEMLVSKIHYGWQTKRNGVRGTFSNFADNVAELSVNVSYLLGTNHRGVKFISRFGRGGYFLNKTKCRAIIAETFFIDSDSDLREANENYDALVSCYVDWFIQYFKEV